MKYLFVLLSAVFVLPLTAQSPWTQPHKGGYAQVGFSMIPTYSSIFYEDGSLELPREVLDIEVQLYGEYGVREGTTLLLSLPVKYVSTGDLNPQSFIITPEKSIVGLGNTTLGIKQAILKNDFKLSAYLNAGIPLINRDENTGLQTGFDAFLITPGISFGAGLGKGYAYGFSGLEIATKNISHSYVGGVEVGYNIADILTAAVVIHARVSLQNREDNLGNLSSNIFTGLYMNNQEYISWGLKIFKEIKNGYGVSAAFYGAFSADRVARSPSFNLGVFKKFDGASQGE